MFGPLDGVRIQPSPYLVGAKRGLKLGNLIHVSSAMYDLMKHANEEELRDLLKNIEVVDIGATTDFTKPCIGRMA